jgi:hypothetical protein
MAAAYRSLDEIPVPGPVQIAETTAGDPAPNTQPRRVQTSSKEKATPTPTPKKR